MKLINKGISIKFDTQKSKVSVTGYEIIWFNKKKFIYIFDGPIFYGNGEMSMWYSKQLIEQVKLLQILESGIQQGGSSDLEEYKFLKKNIKIALDL